MGLQISKIPELVQDEILNYLTITDATTLIEVGGDAATAVKHNRQFWLKKAKQLQFLDPITFRSLDRAPILRLPMLCNLGSRHEAKDDSRSCMELCKNFTAEFLPIHPLAQCPTSAVQCSAVVHASVSQKFACP